jgi:putative two-component system response regulator
LRKGAEIALTHHEKFNGKGYPYGIKGADIPLFGRVVAIADVFDALTSSRPYKEAWPIDKAVALLKSERGEHFDPKLVDIFVGNIDKLLAIYSRQKENPLKFEDFD